MNASRSDLASTTHLHAEAVYEEMHEGGGGESGARCPHGAASPVLRSSAQTSAETRPARKHTSTAPARACTSAQAGRARSLGNRNKIPRTRTESHPRVHLSSSSSCVIHFFFLLSFPYFFFILPPIIVIVIIISKPLCPYRCSRSFYSLPSRCPLCSYSSEKNPSLSGCGKASFLSIYLYRAFPGGGVASAGASLILTRGGAYPPGFGC